MKYVTKKCEICGVDYVVSGLGAGASKYCIECKCDVMEKRISAEVKKYKARKKIES